MELRQLRYFVAVAEAGNISRAAKKIFLTQPALSRQIKALEEEIGQCLLERQANSIRLTPVGDALLVEARKILQHAEAALERVRATGRGQRLRVGYAPSLAAGFLPSAVQCFTQQHPTARVELFDLSTREMLSGLEDESLDVVISVSQARETRGLEWRPLLSAPWSVAVHQNHPFARQSQVSPAELAREGLVVFCQRDYPEYWDTITDWLGRHGQHPTIAGEYDGVDSLMSAVESGLGVGIITTRMTRYIPESVTLKPLATPPDPLCIVAGFRAERVTDKPLAVFIEELRRSAQGRGTVLQPLTSTGG